MRRTLSSLSLIVLLVLGVLALEAPTAAAHGSTLGEGLRLAGSNPFKGEALVAFRINHAMGDVDLAVFDVSGRKVEQVFHGELEAGDHRFALSAHGLPTGLYFARLVTQHGTYTKRIVFTP